MYKYNIFYLQIMITKTHTFLFLLVLLFIDVTELIDPIISCDFDNCNSKCSINISLTDNDVSKYSDYLTGWRTLSKLINSSFISISKPAISDVQYKREGFFYNQAEYLCKLCPYHEYPIPDQCQTARSFRNCYNPMFGYCLDSNPSIRTSCVQNLYLYPIQVFGEYFFPTQKSINFGFINFQSITGQVDIVNQPSHIQNQIIAWSDNGNVLSDWSDEENNLNHGLTKYKVSLHLRYNYYAESRDPPFLEYLRNDYLNPNKHWGLWAQEQCTPFCHRNSVALYKTMNKLTTNEINIPENFFWKEMSKQNVQFEEKFRLCKACPSTMIVSLFEVQNHQFFTNYKNVDSNLWTDFFRINNYHLPYCIPWFGSIPVIQYQSSSADYIRYTEDMRTNNTVQAEFDNALYIFDASIVTRINYTLCPINTYNRVCAHKHLKTAKNNLAWTKQPECTPCEQNWTTLGKIGSWFCVPPLGYYFLNFDKLTMFWDNFINQSNAFARRDLLKYEFECETDFVDETQNQSDCIQCKDNSIVEAKDRYISPQEFNEKYILKDLLEVTLCPSNKYCPSQLESPMVCPPNRKCSKEGSWNILNCTCCAGEYWDGLECVSCGNSAECPPNYYKKDYWKCRNEIGDKTETRNGSCQICEESRLPRNAEYMNESYGIEVSAIRYLCPFRCKLGFKLQKKNSQSSNCDAEYLCTAITNEELEPFSNQGIKYYFPTLRNFYDSVKISQSQSTTNCIPVYTFSTNFDSLKDSTDNDIRKTVSISCIQQNNTLCNGRLCTVTKNATLFQDFVCDLCATQPPPNSSYNSMVSQGSTDIIQRNSLCKWQCDQDFYQNNSVCNSCQILQNRVCASGQIIQGNGCNGIITTFLSPLKDNCVNCSKSFASIPLNSYLNREACQYMPCTRIIASPGYYISSICGGTQSTDVQTQCTKNCSIGFYISRNCTNTSDTVCSPCTEYSTGKYKLKNCSLNQDSEWNTCPVSFYCPGDGSMISCPENKISNPGSTLESSCYCKQGFQPSQLDNNICDRVVCENEIENQYFPGLPISASYLYFDAISKTTTCKKCNSNVVSWDPSINSFSSGTRFGIQSCKCSFTYFSNYDKNMNMDQNITCSLCSTRTYPSMCTANNCNSGNEYGNVSTCPCLLPPFSKSKSSSLCSFDSCVDFFSRRSSASSISQIWSSTGSNLYFAKSSIDEAYKWVNIMNKPTFTFQNVESSSNNQITDETTYQYVFFDIQGDNYINRIYYKRLRDTKEEFCSIDECAVTNVIVPICDVEANLIIQSFKVFKWLNNPLTNCFISSATCSVITTHISSLVLDTVNYFYYIYSLKIMIDPTSSDYNLNIEYNQVSSTCGLKNSSTDKKLLNTTFFNQNTEIVSFLTAYSYPGLDLSYNFLSQNDGVFYLAYNNKINQKCGLQALFKNSNTRSLHLDMSNGNRQLISLTISYSSQNSVTVYAIFDDYVSQRGGVCQFIWKSPSQIVFNEICSTSNQNIRIYFPPIFFAVPKLKFKKFEVIWQTSSNPNFLLHVDENSIVHDYDFNQWQLNSTLYTADNQILTFTEIMNMPYGSLPLSVAFYEKGSGLGNLIGISKNTFFRSDIRKCLIFQYFDGSVCRDHVCKRDENCNEDDPTENKVYDRVEGKCYCKPGFYFIADKCVPCSGNAVSTDASQYFCTGRSDRTSCPISSNLNQNLQLNTYDRRTSEKNCVCQHGQFYTNNSNVFCETCQSKEPTFYCPDGNVKITCPGNYFLYKDNSETISNLNSPVQCSCREGSYGILCKPCPPGYICKRSISSIYQVHNFAVTLFVELKQAVAPWLEINDIVCGTMKAVLHKYFSTDGNSYFPYFKDITLMTNERYYCQGYYDPNARTRNNGAFFVIMVQADYTDTTQNDKLIQMYKLFTADNFNRMFTFTTAMTPYVTPTSILPSSDNPFSKILIQTQKSLCTNNKVPNADRTECECAAGYRWSLSQCIPCPIGFFKATPGISELCTACPKDFTTESEGSSSCISVFKSNVNSSSTFSTLPMIIGGAVGGFVLLLLIICVICLFSYK